MTIGVVLALWQALVVVGRIPAYLLPDPRLVAMRLISLASDADLARHVSTTFAEILIGFLTGSLAGVLVGWIFSRAPALARFLSPLILLLQTAPKIAIAPLLLLWLGLGLLPKVTLIAIVSFFPVLTATLAGLGSVEPSYRELARVLRLSPTRRFLRVELPFALPPILAGARIATTQAVTAAVVGELMGATFGLGYLLSLGQENNDAATVIVAIILLATLGWFLHEAVRAIEIRLLRWRS